MNKRQVLVNQGWGLMPIYVGRQADSEHLNAATGKQEADDAMNLATSAGFTNNITIYLDVETAFPLTSNYLSYVTAWVNEIQSKGYIAGIYCNTKTASQIKNALTGNIEFWVAHYTGCSLPASVLSPVDSGVPFAGMWQFAGDSTVTCGGYSIQVDLNTSTLPDPSMPSGSTPTSVKGHSQ